MKRLFLILLMAFAVLSANPAFADPPATNKNNSVFTFSCARGSETAGFQAVAIAQSQSISGHLLDGTATVHFVRIVVDGQVIFEVPAQVDRPDVWSCTIAEVPGGAVLVFVTPRS